MVIHMNFSRFLFPVLMIVTLSSCSFQKHTRKTHTENVNPTRFEIVKDAHDALGAGYRYGATGSKRYDCSGLIYTLFATNEIALPRSTKAMAQYGEKIKKDDLLPGDLIFFKNVGKIDHVAMVSRMSPAKTWLIHSTTSRGVIEEVLEDSSYWSRRVVQYRRVIP